MGTRLKFAEYFGLRRNLVLLLAAVVLIGAGEETWSRFVPKYLETLGATALIIGLYDGLKTLLGALYAWPGGVLTDRWGHRRALAAFNAISIAGYALVLWIPHWTAVIGGMFLFLAWSTLSLPAMFSLVAASLSREKHTMGIGVQSLVKRIPIIAGPIIGGVLIDRLGIVGGVRAGLVISIAMGLLSLLLVWRMEETPPIAAPASGSFRSVVHGFDHRLRWLLASDIMVRFCERIPYAWVVIYAMDNVHASAMQVGILTAVEMVVAIACYIPVAHFADQHGREPFVVATFFFFTVFPLALAMAHSFPWLVAAFAIRGLKEFGDPARKALIVSYARPEMRGRMIGAYYLIRDTVVSVGSLAGALLWKISPQTNLLTASALGVIGTLVYWRWGRDAASRVTMQ